MTPDELLAWQARHFGTGYGAQVQAAKALGQKVPTYRSWLAGRRPMPSDAALTARYIDRFGVLPTDGSDGNEETTQREEHGDG